MSEAKQAAPPKWAIDEADALDSGPSTLEDRIMGGQILRTAYALAAAYARGREDAALVANEILCRWGCSPKRPSMRAEVVDAIRAGGA